MQVVGHNLEGKYLHLWMPLGNLLPAVKYSSSQRR